MKRKVQWIALAGLVAVIALGVGTGVLIVPLPSAPTPPCPPACNVILISLDTLRADHLGTYGYERPTSPQIDAFAEDAIVFEEAISQSSWTTPAHSSMMTGLLPHEHGLVYYKSPGRIAEEVTTLAERLADEGYRTVSFNGGGYVSEEFGISDGFEIYRRGPGLDEALARAQTLLSSAQEDQRLFLFVHGYDVHRPYDADEKYNTFSDHELEFDIADFCLGERRKLDGQEQLDHVVSQYDAGIVYVDELVGGFLESLARSYQLERSIVIITSDHGDEFYEHGSCDHISTVYDELTRVPLIIRVPGMQPGRVSGQVPASVSILPTVLDVLRLDSPIAMTHTLLPALQTGQADFPFVISETGSQAGQWFLRSVRAPDWKLVMKANPSGSRDFELYHLSDDPSEQLNRFSTEAQRLEGDPTGFPATVSELARVANERPIPEMRSERLVVTDDTEEQLRALGYLEGE